MPEPYLAYPFLENEEVLSDFVDRWTRGSLPKSSWTHGAHVGVAAYFAFDHPEVATFSLMKAGILHFNTCVGTPNTGDSGYHETLTRFWSATISEFIRAGRFASRFEAVRETVRRFGEERDRHKLFYSFDVVRDRRARQEWVEPDRKPFSGDLGSELLRVMRDTRV
jgi:Arc/MetJ-type ribon-helix-helix transcriptional regulator